MIYTHTYTHRYNSLKKTPKNAHTRTHTYIDAGHSDSKMGPAAAEILFPKLHEESAETEPAPEIGALRTDSKL